MVSVNARFHPHLQFAGHQYVGLHSLPESLSVHITEHTVQYRLLVPTQNVKDSSAEIFYWIARHLKT